MNALLRVMDGSKAQTLHGFVEEIKEAQLALQVLVSCNIGIAFRLRPIVASSAIKHVISFIPNAFSFFVDLAKLSSLLE